MKVKVTKKMVSELNKALKAKKEGGEYTSINKFYFETRAPYFYESLYDYNCDCDNNGNVIIKYIKVTYNDDCYAMPGSLSTSELRDAYYNSDKTYDDFLRCVFEKVEI